MVPHPSFRVEDTKSAVAKFARKCENCDTEYKPKESTAMSSDYLCSVECERNWNREQDESD